MSHKETRGFTNLNELEEDNPRLTNHLFVVAIDEYEFCPKLSNAVKDAKDFIEVVTSRYDFDPNNVFALYDSDATEENILKRFEYYAKNMTQTDNLVIYFSGHGEENKIFKEGYWVPVEAQMGAIAQYIPNSMIRTILSSIDTHHTFLIVDSCFSGSLFSRANRSLAGRLEKDPSRWGLTSGRSEVVADGEPGANSPFASSLLYCLKNSAKSLGVQELCAKVLEMTVANAHQTPLGEPLKVEGHRNGQFVFHLKRDEVRDWEAANKMNTLVAFKNFIKMYPESKHIAEAEAKLSKLRDEAVWLHALAKNTIVDFYEYQMTYPNGRFVREAIAKIAALEEEDFWKNATFRDTLGAYNTYLLKYPEGQYKAEAQTRISQKILHEKEDVGALGTSLENTPQPPVIEENKHLKSKIEEEEESTFVQISKRFHDDSEFSSHTLEHNFERVINSKHNLYWILVSAGTWIVLLLAILAEVENHTGTSISFLVMMIAPVFVAFSFPIKDKQKPVIYLSIAFGLFILFFVVDLLTGGAFLEMEDGGITSLVLLLAMLAVIYGSYYLNKIRYDKVLKELMNK